MTKGRKARGTAPAKTPKGVYVYPLHPDWRTILLHGPRPLVECSSFWSVYEVSDYLGCGSYGSRVVPEVEFSAADVLEWYRTQWQVELVFKRFKSLAVLGHLPKHDEHSARAWLYGKLFVALLVEKLIGHARAISPWGYELGSVTASQRLARLPVHAEPSQAGH